MAVALHAAPDHASVEHAEGGEQGCGAVALVIVRHGPAAPGLDRQPGLGAGERRIRRMCGYTAAGYLPGFRLDRTFQFADDSVMEPGRTAFRTLKKQQSLSRHSLRNLERRSGPQGDANTGQMSSVAIQNVKLWAAH